jgi:hypothetical protein
VCVGEFTWGYRSGGVMGRRRVGGEGEGSGGKGRRRETRKIGTS